VRSRTIRQCASSSKCAGVGAVTRIPYGESIIHLPSDDRRDS
jgi:hypothetical protein